MSVKWRADKHLTLKHNENILLLYFSFVCVVWMDATCAGAQEARMGHWIS